MEVFPEIDTDMDVGGGHVVPLDVRLGKLPMAGQVVPGSTTRE
jgi:hypothetical protein